jgi:nicotinate-nucleotide pyrophosphorylase (carboxylating)
MTFETNESLEQARTRNIRDALMEDIGRADWTARLVPQRQRVPAQVVAKEAAILCGTQWFDGCILALDAAATVRWNAQDGDSVTPGTVVCTIAAQARALPPAWTACPSAN